jgi:transglutaminase/protease-like cytokinesis protein 3
LSQSYEKVDSIVLKYPKKISSTTKIAKLISSDFSTDFDKIRAVYTWITNNIAYDLSEYGKYKFNYSNKKELIDKQIKFEKKLSSRVISKRKAVCQGYSTLFKVICDKLNINSKVVSGSSKTLVRDIGNRYYSDHSWNFVTIKNKDYLIDTTWGAGNYSNSFEKKVNFFYFLTNPIFFIKQHYPDNYENTLLTEKIEKKDFLNGPLIYDYNFELINPLNGIIKKGEDNIVRFKFLTEKKISSISYNIDRKNFILSEFENEDNLEFEINLSDIKNEKTLLLYFDYKPVIGFKLE